MPLIALEIVLGFVVPIGWGVWQLVELRRLNERDQARIADDETGADSEAG